MEKTSKTLWFQSPIAPWWWKWLHLFQKKSYALYSGMAQTLYDRREEVKPSRMTWLSFRCYPLYWLIIGLITFCKRWLLIVVIAVILAVIFGIGFSSGYAAAHIRMR